MGDGNQRAHLRELAGGLPNLDFLPPADDADFPDVLAAADVLAVTQRASVLDMSVPSKLTSYFAAGPAGGRLGRRRRAAPPQEVAALGRRVGDRPEDPRRCWTRSAYWPRTPSGPTRLGACGPQYVEQQLSSEAGLARITALLRTATATASR